MAKLTQIEAAKLAPFDKRMDELEAQEERQREAEQQESSEKALSAGTLAALEGMTQQQLIVLIKCFPARITGYALQTKDERREAMKLKVYEIAMSAANDAVTLKAANDWLDREDGKATVMVHQHIQQENTLTVLMARALGELREASTEDVLKIKHILENGSDDQV